MKSMRETILFASEYSGVDEIENIILKDDELLARIAGLNERYREELFLLVKVMSAGIVHEILTKATKENFDQLKYKIQGLYELLDKLTLYEEEYNRRTSKSPD